MDSIIAFLIDWGAWGMLFSAFLAGSFLPFSSEAVMLGLLAAGVHPWPLILYGTVGNVAGGLFNYAIGRQGRLDWIEKYLHVKPEKLQRAQRFMGERGALMGFFAFLPFIGSAITIALGLMRANLLLSTLSITAGKFLRYVLLAMSTVSLTACTSPTAKSTQTLMVSIEPLRYFAEEIAGNRFQVTTMVPQNSNPETYEPTAQQMMALSESRLFFMVGEIGFERTWAKRLQQNAPQTTFVNTSNGIKLIAHGHGISDPHTWMSCRNADIMARNMLQALTQCSPKDSSYFAKNFQRLQQTIAQTHQALTATLQGKHPAFLIYHPSLSYFAHEYGLQQLTIEEEGREPSALQLQQLIETARQRKPRVLFMQKEFANRNIRVVAESTHTKIVEINPLSYQWPQEMRHIAQALK